MRIYILRRTLGDAERAQAQIRARGKPTNRAFLAQICEHLRLRRMDAQEETYPS